MKFLTCVFFFIFKGVVGAEKSMFMIKQHQYMGFLSFCDN